MCYRFLTLGITVIGVGQVEAPNEVWNPYSVPSPSTDYSIETDHFKGWFDENYQWHRDDGPAIINEATFTEKWYRHGKLHRTSGPAVKSQTGSYWYRDGKLHRDYGPAVELPSGHKHWYKNGVLHREDGPAVIVPDYGEEWYFNGNRHREGGPAITYYFDGSKFWYDNGKLIRSELSEEMQDAARNYPVAAPKH